MGAAWHQAMLGLAGAGVAGNLEFGPPQTAGGYKQAAIDLDWAIRQAEAVAG